MRHYTVILKKSGSRIPRIELTEIGPSMDLAVRRTRFASEDLKNVAFTHHTVKKSKGKKNVLRDELSQEIGKIHVGNQNLSEMSQRFTKALRNKRSKKDDEPEADGSAAKKQKTDGSR